MVAASVAAPVSHNLEGMKRGGDFGDNAGEISMIERVATNESWKPACINDSGENSNITIAARHSALSDERGRSKISASMTAEAMITALQTEGDMPVNNAKSHKEMIVSHQRIRR